MIAASPENLDISWLRRYTLTMTKLLEEAIEKARLLPAGRQNDVAEILLTVVEQTVPGLSKEQIAGVHEAIAEADAGNLVDKAEIDKVFAKHLV